MNNAHAHESEKCVSLTSVYCALQFKSPSVRPRRQMWSHDRLWPLWIGSGTRPMWSDNPWLSPHRYSWFCPPTLAPWGAGRSIFIANQYGCLWQVTGLAALIGWRSNQLNPEAFWPIAKAPREAKGKPTQRFESETHLSWSGSVSMDWLDRSNPRPTLNDRK